MDASPRLRAATRIVCVLAAATHERCVKVHHVSKWRTAIVPARFRLRFALVAYVVIPLTAALSLLWYLAVSEFQELAEQRMKEEIELIARALDVPVSRAIDQGSIPRMRQSLESALAFDRVYGAYVYDRAGDLVLAIGRPPDDPPSRIRDIAVEGSQRGEYGEVAGRRIFSYFVPLSDLGGRVTGVLQVTRRRRDFDDYFSALRRQALMALALCAAMTAGVVLWGHHHALGKHVRRLSKDMQRVAGGARDHRAATDGPEEVGVLAMALNTMLDSIQRSEQRLEEQRGVQAELEQRLIQAEKLAAIGGLAAGVAHELGAPLSVVGGQAQRMQRDPDLSSWSLRAAQQIRTQVNRMEKIVRNLLDFGGDRALHKKPLSVGGLVARCCIGLAGFAETNQVRLSNEDGTGEISVLADGVSLARTITELIRNAIQAATGGQVRVRTFADGDDAVIVIDDDGSGVNQEIRSRIFEPFFTTKPVGQGSGLGLSIAHRTIEDLSGTIQVGTASLGGARFTIRIPQIEGGRKP